ncbi:3-phenylpropionate dioxygenase beta subunit [Escherichia coli]|uniref:3-phenylpropionate dioxygenase beta subunit n=1 Tax=Escherichia coli TaxID=562 RepID=A0A377BV60_ECOLX|nr:3-phenylpropionate dioxygenase beta subunit [Escherichia coli]
MSAQVSLELHHRISQFLFHEASLLDDWKFRDWLAQLDEEIRYTMRTTVNAQTRDRRKGVQPPTTWILMTPKTSWSGESPVWKRHGLGRRAAVTHSSLNQQLPGKRNRHPKCICREGELSTLSGTKRAR